MLLLTKWEGEEEEAVGAEGEEALWAACSSSLAAPTLQVISF